MADGTVKIDVKVMTDQAVKEANRLRDAYKGVKLNASISKEITALTTATAKAGGATIKLSNEVKSGSSSYSALQSELKATSSYYNSLSQAQAKSGNQFQASLSKQKAVEAELTGVNLALDKSKQAVVENTKQFGLNSEATEKAKSEYMQLSGQQSKLASEYNLLNKSVGNMTPNMAKAADQANLFGKRMRTAGDTMTDLGGKATTHMTVPIVAGMGLATKAASDYQYQLADIRKEVQAQGYSASQVNSIMADLSTKTLDWSKKFGVGTKEINDGMFELVSNGYNVKQAIGMMPELLKTMTANSDKTGVSIKLTSSMLEQFGMNLGSNNKVIKNGNLIMNQMTEATHKSAMSLDDLKTISGNAGAAMHGMKVSTNDFLAVAGRLKSAGIDASSVGTGLSSMMTRLSTGTGRAAKDLDKYNIKVHDSSGNMRNILDILGDMQGAYKGMTDQEKQKFMYDVIGQENMKVGMTLMDANLGRYRSLSNEIANSTGTVDKYNQTMRKTNEFTEQQFKSSLRALEIEFGQKMLPALTPVIKQMTNMIDRFGKLDSGTQQTIVKFGLFAAAVGPVTSILGKTTKGMGTLAKGTSKLISLFGKGSGLAGASTELATGLGAISAPALGVVAALGGIAAVTAIAIKGYNDHQKALKKQQDVLNEYGVSVDRTTQKAMRSFNKLQQSATDDMNKLDSATVSQSQKLSKDATEKYSKMADTIINQYNRVAKKGQDTLNEIGSSFGVIGQQWSDKVNSNIQQGTDQSVKKLQDAKKTISQILSDTGGDLSRMTSLQREDYQDATDYISKQTSAFGIAEKDQEALYNQYVNNRSKITRDTLNKDLSETQKAYKHSEQAAKSSYDKQSKIIKDAYKRDEITKQQQNQALDALDAEKQRNTSKANIEWLKTTKSAYSNFKDDGTELLRSKVHMNQVEMSIDGQGNQLYYSAVQKRGVTRKQWIEDTKKDNQKYIKEQEKSHNSIDENLKDFEKKQEKAYKDMGLSSKQANQQAKLDMQELANEVDKSASQMENDADKIHTSFIKGLKSGSINGSQIAKEWGLDLQNSVKNIDLGKYGRKSASEFWSDFSSGSKSGYAEAKIYFQNQIGDFKKQGLTSAKSLGSGYVSELRSGLSAGVITLNDLKPLMGKKVLDIFPKDLSQVSDGEMQSLKSGYQNGLVSLKQLKNQFGDAVYKLFPDKLDDLGEKEIKTLQEGLKNGKINVNDLKSKYNEQLKEIYSQDLSDLGKEDIASLKVALKAGITNEAELKQNFSSTLDRIYNQTPQLSKISQGNIDTLKKSMKLGITNPQEIESHYKQQLDSIYKKNLSQIGKGDIDTLVNGLKLGLPGTKNAMKGLTSEIKKGATVNLKGVGKVDIQGLAKGYESGKISITQFTRGLQKLVQESTKTDLSGNGANATQSYSNGLSSGKDIATGTASAIKGATAASFAPTDEPHQHGTEHDTNFEQGMIDIKDDVLRTAEEIKNKTASKFTPSKKVHKHGKEHPQKLSQGMLATSGLPLSLSGAIEEGINSNFNASLSSKDNVTSGLGGGNVTSKKFSYDPIKNLKGFKTGTNGQLSTEQTAVVGDGFEPELITFGNGGMALSPPVPTMVHLPRYSQVFSGTDTRKIQSATEALGIPLFKNGSGGGVGDFFNNVGNAVGSGWDWIKSVVGDIEVWLEHPIESWGKLIDNQFDMSAFSASTNAPVGNGAKSYDKKQTKWLEKLVQEMADPPGSGAARWRPQVIRALSMLGLSTDDAMVNKVLRQIQTESGGNAHAIGGNDGLADGNAMGLMQVKPGTFSAYALPGHKNIMNGFDNLLAGLNYAKHRYGSGLSFLGNGHGYDQGGWINHFGLYPVGEKNKEVVINPQRDSAVPLVNETLAEIQKYQPDQLTKIHLPGQDVTPEQASGYTPLPTNYSDRSTMPAGSSGDEAKTGLLGNIGDNISNAIGGFADKISGDVNINLQIDGTTLAKLILPKLEVLGQAKINVQQSRKGWLSK